jgi:hypothetical protein
MENEKLHWFGEWVEYRTEEEKEEARVYLNLWKKFFCMKVPSLKIVDEQIIDNLGYDFPGEYITSIKSTLGIKISMRGYKPDFVLTIDEKGLCY